MPDHLHGPDPDGLADPDLGELLQLAIALATEAGSLLLDGRSDLRVDVVTKSSATDMVTDMDRASEELIVRGLQRARPHDAILGEEGGEHAGTTEIRWVIDPLDGTTNYLYGHPNFAVSIAAERLGETVVGVVADPSHGEVFSATAHSGASRNGRPIRVSGKEDLPTSLIGTGFGYGAEHRIDQARVLEGVLGEVRDIRRYGSAALDLCWVACGRLDGFYEAGLEPWDVAAGELIARRAGALTSDFDGAPAGPGAVLAATPAIAGPLRRLLSGAGARALVRR